MTIRAATISDAEGIAEVHVLTWKTAYRGLLPNTLLDKLSVKNSQKRWQTRLAEGTQTFVLEQNGQVRGFVAFGPSRDNDAAQEKVGEIYALYLTPEMWGAGHGRALCTAALTALREQGFSEVTLWVLHNNLRAIKFYEAAGFKADGAAKVETRANVAFQEIRYRLKFELTMNLPRL